MTGEKHSRSKHLKHMKEQVSDDKCDKRSFGDQQGQRSFSDLQGQATLGDLQGQTLLDNLQGQTSLGDTQGQTSLGDLHGQRSLGDLQEETRLACIVIDNAHTSFPSVIDSSKANVPKSLKQEKTNYNYNCFKCGKNLRNRAKLNLHMVTEHGEENEIGKLCKHCGKHVDFDHELELHHQFLCRKLKKKFACAICKLSFRTSIEMEEHPCTKDASKPFFCLQEKCSFAGKKFKDLTEHVTRHLGIKPFLCNVCGRAFAAKKDMDRHTDVHRDTKDYSCKDCGHSYRSLHSLNRHMMVHKFKDRFKCSECSYTSALKSSFNQHMLKHKKRSHKCNLCDKFLRSEKSLKKHIQNRHAFNRIFTCRYCEFTTDDGPRYASHMRKHRHLKNLDSNKTMDKTISEEMLDLSNLAINSSSENILSDITSNAEGKLYRPFTIATIPPSATMTLAAAAIHAEEVDISGQNADAIMANYVASADSSDISVITSGDVGSGSLGMYNVENPAGTESLPTCSSGILNMPPLMSDTMAGMMDTEEWDSNT